MQGLLLFPCGFIAGLLFWPRVLRWGFLLFFLARGKEDDLSELLAPGGRISFAAVLINSGLFLTAGILAFTILYTLGSLPRGSGNALAGLYAALLLIAVNANSLLRTRQSKEAAFAARDRKVRLIIEHKTDVFLGLALGWSIPATIGLAVTMLSLSARALLCLCAVFFVSGLLMAALLWFTIIRVAVDDYEYKRRRAEKRG